MFSTGNTPKTKVTPPTHTHRERIVSSPRPMFLLSELKCVIVCERVGGSDSPSVWVTEGECVPVWLAHIVCSLSHCDCGPCPQNCALGSLNRLARRSEGSTQGCVILTVIIWLPMEYQRSELSHLTCLIGFLWFQKKNRAVWKSALDAF